MELELWGAPSPISVRDATTGTFFTTTGPDAALYVAVSGNGAIRLKRRDGAGLDLSFVSRGNLRGPTFALDSSVRLFIRPGGADQPHEIFFDVVGQPQHGHIAIGEHGAAHLIVETPDAIEAFDLETWVAVEFGQVARRGVQYLSRWTLWRTSSVGSTPAGDQLYGDEHPIGTFVPSPVFELPDEGED